MDTLEVEMWPQGIKVNDCSLVLYMAEVVCCASRGANTAEGDGAWPEWSTTLALVCDMIPG